MPEIKTLGGKKVEILLNSNRKICGTLSGYDPFLNLVIEDVKNDLDLHDTNLNTVIVRGNSVISIKEIYVENSGEFLN